jgi:hypothetical protein
LFLHFNPTTDGARVEAVFLNEGVKDHTQLRQGLQR